MKPPERLHLDGAVDLERRLLEAAARERPSDELRQRMAAGLGLSLVAPIALDPTSSNGLTESSASTAGQGSVMAPGVATGANVGQGVALGSKLLVALGSGAVVSVIAVTWFLAAPSTLRSSAGLSGAVSTANVVRSVASVSDVLAPAVLPPAPGESTSGAGPAISAKPDPVAASDGPVHSTRARDRSSLNADDLREQIALLDSARSALAAGGADRALGALSKYQAKFPRGSFGPEATALKVEALAKLGRRAEARALGERFVKEHRGTALADRVARAAGLPISP